MEIHDANALVIYLGGARVADPPRFGTGFLIIGVDAAGNETVHPYSPSGRYGAGDDDLELAAAVESLRMVCGSASPIRPGSYTKIILFCGSHYLLESLHAAEFLWAKNGWVGRTGEPIPDAALWKELIRLKRRAGRVEFRQLKAPNTNPYRHQAQYLAEQSAATARSRPSAIR